MAVDAAKLERFMGRVGGRAAGRPSAAVVVFGNQLGLNRPLGSRGPATPADLATRTGTSERYVREWLCAQAAGGYVDYDPATARFCLNAEQTMVFADEQSPAFAQGGFQVLTALFKDEPKITAAFRTGKGVGWHEHDPALFVGTERFFRPNYNANLTTSWIPALEGVEQKLRAGARVADVGCGLGTSTIIMARAYPRSTFVGFDYHEPSITRARAAAAGAGVGERARFEVARAQDYPGTGYDLVAFFDCLHDMGDPVGAATHVRRSLAPDGTWMLVEPFAGDRVEDNLNPIGRVFYSASTMVCTPASLAQEVGLALGAQAGEKRLRDAATEAGFTRFPPATAAPFSR